MRRAIRLMSGAASVTAVAVLGSGCTPGPEPIIAVESGEGGSVRLLLAKCPGYRAESFGVFADVEEGELQNWSVRNPDYRATPAGVRIFEVPEGWKVSASALTALSDGVPYVADVEGATGAKGLDGRVPFTLADVEELKPGKVLISAGGEKNKAVDRDDFLNDIPPECD
ncbi:hypothetical protein ACIBCM_18245 [Streptomyces sp. NPDC051018]|uniref:hypothetical protein n=1 Tax=Streptomyces sp. NPDC051018 TaxID=3365639 RepID=UPI0037B3A4D6